MSTVEMPNDIELQKAETIKMEVEEKVEVETMNAAEVVEFLGGLKSMLTVVCAANLVFGILYLAPFAWMTTGLVLPLHLVYVIFVVAKFVYVYSAHKKNRINRARYTKNVFRGALLHAAVALVTLFLATVLSATMAFVFLPLGAVVYAVISVVYWLALFATLVLFPFAGAYFSFNGRKEVAAGIAEIVELGAEAKDIVLEDVLQLSSAIKAINLNPYDNSDSETDTNTDEEEAEEAETKTGCFAGMCKA